MSAAQQGTQRLPEAPWLAAGLSCVAGMVDVASWITLSGLFTAHVTGNLVVMAADAVTGHRMHLAAAIAIPLFVVLTAAIGVVVQILQPSGRGKLLAMLAVQSLLLAGCAAVALTAPASHSSAGLWIAILAIGAMAIQNALLHLGFTPVPTTAVMTGNIVAATLGLIGMLLAKGAARQQAWSQWHQTAPILFGFVMGCLAGAGAVASLGSGAWAVPAAASMLLWVIVGAGDWPVSETVH